MNIPLQTIADLAGVSRSTVSLALRNRPKLAAATRERIQKIAEEIGYRPNSSISTLMTHLRSARTLLEQGVLAFLTNHPTRDGWRKDEFRTYERFFEGAAARADRNGYRLDVFWMKEPGMTSSRMKKILEARGIQGAVIAPLLGRGGHLSLDISDLATVTFGVSVKRPKLHRVDNYQVQSVRTAMRELKRRGYRRIGFAAKRDDDRHVDYNWSTDYLEYQHRVLGKHLPIYYPEVPTRETALEWIKSTQVDAILCINTKIPKMIESSLPIPEQLGVVILDRFDTDHAFAGIDGRPELSGAAAIDLLIGQLHRNERGVPTAPKLVLSEGIWVDGESVRPPRVGRSAGEVPVLV